MTSNRSSVEVDEVVDFVKFLDALAWPLQVPEVREKLVERGANETQPDSLIFETKPGDEGVGRILVMENRLTDVVLEIDLRITAKQPVTDDVEFVSKVFADVTKRFRSEFGKPKSRTNGTYPDVTWQTATGSTVAVIRTGSVYLEYKVPQLASAEAKLRERGEAK